MKNLGDILRAAREASRRTATAVAAQLGTTRSHYAQLEKGAMRPGPALLQKLARIFRLDPERLLAFRQLEGRPPGLSTQAIAAAAAEILEAEALDERRRKVLKAAGLEETA